MNKQLAAFSGLILCRGSYGDLLFVVTMQETTENSARTAQQSKMRDRAFKGIFNAPKKSI